MEITLEIQAPPRYETRQVKLPVEIWEKIDAKKKELSTPGNKITHSWVIERLLENI